MTTIVPPRDLDDHSDSAVKRSLGTVRRETADDSEFLDKGPRESGFRMPAEWEPHEATWICWPHNRTDWPGKFATIPWVCGEIVRKIAPGEIVRIIVSSQKHEAQARRVLTSVGVDLTRIEFFHFPTNRSWTRDFGPMFVKREAKQTEVAIVRFRFNAWAKYRDWKKDDMVTERAAAAVGCRLFHARINNHDVVLEGGAIDVNGRGTLVTTEECLLDRKVQARNPSLSSEETELLLHDYLGATNVIWLNRGIEGDDTHGHVDDICRFVNAQTVIVGREKNSRDYNYRVLEENLERLQSSKLEDGSRVDLVPFPMPEPLVFKGRRLPASYANFYIANAAVLAPTFNDPNDRIALGILSELIRDRPVVGVHAVDLVWGLGTIHCMTQQQPSS